ncbi:hypothetical protein M378DRAFT_172477 [Amanita muscaria Koide BX008]|uniref:Uncharacterized protein n=1 Tax=Amanita muscaria (strain Koide BX008) TaxID=946122 RepID=A0A0C2WJ67_AMAMK|nr:hypothetical protein M378DRAFT_172477 [Amanita muscaria Koide BX008]
MSPQLPKSATTIDGAVLDDKRDPDIPIPSQASATLRPQSINHPGIAVPSKAPPTTPIQTEMPLVAPEHPSINRGDVVQRREVRHEVDPTEAPTVAIEPCFMVCRDGDTGSEEVPSISLFQGSSNFQISNTNINTISGNATLIRFGDGQFTEIQRNLVCSAVPIHYDQSITQYS